MSGTVRGLKGLPYLNSLKGVTEPTPLINKPPPLNRDYNRDPIITGLERRGFIHHGSTLGDCLGDYCRGH